MNDLSSWKGRLVRKASAVIYMNQQQESKPPIELGTEIEVLISSVTRKGRGVGKYKGVTVIINGAADPGETVRARVVKMKDNKIIAEVVDY